MFAKLTALTLSTLLLSACGFALRGSAALSPDLQPLLVEAQDSGSALNRELLRALDNNDVQTTTDGSAARYQLGIGLETSSERALSVNANARAGEYELIVSAPFQLRRGSELVLAPEVLTLSRIYLADPENAIAKTEEAELIRSEMRRELAQQILRRLQAVNSRAE